MIVKEIYARSILSRSKVFDYVVNPYVGCQHACTYCYARFMKRFTKHKEPWGEFVDVKTNASELLLREVERVPPGKVWVSGVCDPYQPLEAAYGLTRKCLDILLRYEWPVTIQTKSALVLRDMELLKMSSKIEVVLTITTGDESMRRLFEPGAPSIEERVKALEELHFAGIKTSVMIAPMLPGAERLVDWLSGKVDYVLIDRMNYHYSDWVYRKHNLDGARSDAFFWVRGKQLTSVLKKRGIKCQVLF